MSKIACTISIFVLSSVLVACSSEGLSNKRAKEGRGLLTKPSVLSEVPTGVVSSYVFRQESPDLYSRILFDTDEAPDFRIQVREYCLPPRQGLTAIRVEGDALLEMRTEHGTLTIGNREQIWIQGATLVVPAAVSIELGNPTDREVIVRLHILEGK